MKTETELIGVKTTKKLSLAERCKKVMPPMAQRVTELGVLRGEGCYLYSEDSKEILDFSSGIAVNNLGHGHPKVVAAAKDQLGTLIHACHNVVYYEPYVTLAEKLVSITGGDMMVYFSNSGGEANEGALKLAKYVTKRPAVISFMNSFHGRTYASMSITASSSAYRKHYEAVMPSVYFAEYPNLYRTPYTAVNGECPVEYMRQFDDIFHKLVDPTMVAAIILEPMQGEGGYIVPPVEWLKYVRNICDQHGILLIFDEVQTGIGRTGNFFAYQTLGVEPDILTSAKGLANGLPLSAVIGKKKYMQRWEKGAHGGTFGGNPVACAAALAVLDVLTEEHVLENARNMGEYLRGKLFSLQKKYSSFIGDVRGLGLMNAMELVKEGQTPNSELTAVLMKTALEKDLLLLNCGTEKNVIRFLPPLIVKKEEIDKATDIVDECLSACLKG